MDEEDIEDAVIIHSDLGHASWANRAPLSDCTPATREQLAVSPLYVDPLALELPHSVQRPAQGVGEMLDQTRAKLAQHLGIVPPSVHVEEVDGERWRLLLHQDEIAGGSSRDAKIEDILGLVGDALEAHAGEMLTFDATSSLMSWAREESPALVSSLVPNVYDVSTIRGTLKALLREGVPIRPISVVLGAMSDVGRQSGSVELAEAIRPSLWRLIRRRIAQADGAVRIIRVAPGAVHGIVLGVQHTGSGHTLRVPDDLAREFQRSFDEAREASPDLAPLVLACPSQARRWVSIFVARKNPGVLVVGDEELAHMPGHDEIAMIGEGIVPVPPSPGDGRQAIEAYVEGGSYGGWGSSGGYLFGG